MTHDSSYDRCFINPLFENNGILQANIESKNNNKEYDPLDQVKVCVNNTLEKCNELFKKSLLKIINFNVQGY